MDESGRADVERLLTFVDAIVAIAITLLVLPLAELAGDIGDDESVWHVVREHAGEFAAFVLSFVVIARLWLAQHQVVRTAEAATRPFIAALIAWTLTIAFLPFPTALLADAGSQAATKVFYIGTLSVSFALLGALAWAVRRQNPGASHPRPLPSLLNAVFGALALVVALTVPAINYYALLLLLLADPADRAIRRRM